MGTHQEDVISVALDGQALTRGRDRYSSNRENLRPLGAIRIAVPHPGRLGRSTGGLVTSSAAVRLSDACGRWLCSREAGLAQLLWTWTDVAVLALDNVPGRLRCRRDSNPRTERGRPAPSPPVAVSGTSHTAIAMGHSATAPQPARMRGHPAPAQGRGSPVCGEPLSSTGSRCTRTTEVEPEPEHTMPRCGRSRPRPVR